MTAPDEGEGRVDTINSEGLARELVAAMPTLDADEQRVALSLYRQLGEAKPVAPDTLASLARLPLERVQDLLERWPGVYREGERVIGFWGLALDGMPHKLHVNGRELHAWCAWDTLFLPELLGARAEVESPCPTTGERISLEVVPRQGVRNVSPTGALMSFLHRDEPFDADSIQTFCHFVHFLRDDDAARAWTARNEGTFSMSIDDGFEVGALTNRRRFGAMLGV